MSTPECLRRVQGQFLEVKHARNESQLMKRLQPSLRESVWWCSRYGLMDNHNYICENHYSEVSAIGRLLRLKG